MHESTAADVRRQAHAALLGDLGKLKESLQPQSSANLMQICELLVATRRLVASHFGLEEKDGWIVEVRRQEPRWEHATVQLVQEHRQLVSSLESLIEETDAADYLSNALRQKILRWIERLIDHETRENDLFEDAFIEDLGAGD